MNFLALLATFGMSKRKVDKMFTVCYNLPKPQQEILDLYKIKNLDVALYAEFNPVFNYCT